MRDDKGNKTLYQRGLHGIGYLLRVERELVWSEKEAVEVQGWDLEVDGPIPTEKVTYIKLFDGREFRWTNASFLKVPIELE